MNPVGDYTSCYGPSTRIAHACKMGIVHACTMVIVHACTLAVVHACFMAIVHACMMAVVKCIMSYKTHVLKNLRRGVWGAKPSGEAKGCERPPAPPMLNVITR